MPREYLRLISLICEVIPRVADGDRTLGDNFDKQAFDGFEQNVEENECRRAYDMAVQAYGGAFPKQTPPDEVGCW